MQVMSSKMLTRRAERLKLCQEQSEEPGDDGLSESEGSTKSEEEGSTKSEEEGSTKSVEISMLDEISKLLDKKIADLATKEDISELKNTILLQNQKIQMLEAKTAVMERYEEQIEKLQRRVDEIDDMNERIEELEARSDDNEQYHRRLCLRIDGVALKDGEDGESGPECLKLVKDLIKKEMKVNIPEMAFDRAHRIGSVKEDADTQKRSRQIIVRFTTWSHRTQVYRARKKTEKFRVRLDLTYRRAKILERASELLKGKKGCFVFADVNCRLTLYLDDKYHSFSNERELLEHIKYV